MGIRELKNRLSAYLRRVRDGGVVQITDRGTVIAEIRPPGQPADASRYPNGLLELARQGELTLGLPNDRSLYRVASKPLLRGTTSKELLDWLRGQW